MYPLSSNVGSLTEVATAHVWPERKVREQVRLRIRRFRSLGLERGDRVLIHFGNQIEFFVEILAVWQLGGCVIPVDGGLTPSEVGKLAAAAGAKFSVIADDTESSTLENLVGAKTLHTSEVCNTAPLKNTASKGLWLDDDALVLFTSGTTGEPKGVLHTHRSLRARWITLQQSLGTKPYRRTLCMLPTHFGHGLICNALFPWLSGCDLYIAPPFSPGVLMSLGGIIDEFQITAVSSVPSMWNLILRTSKNPVQRTLERIHIGSAPLSTNLWSQVQGWSSTNDVLNSYGITETGSWVGGASGNDVALRDGLIGVPWGAKAAVFEARSVSDLAESDRECETEEPGMIWINTPALMKGYLDRDDLTAAVVHQGWFVTGDIGLLDGHGRLTLCGREREEINKAGIKVYPAEIDSVVQQFDGVKEACTFSVDDELYGENVAIAIVLDVEEPQVIVGLYAWIKERLAERKQPERWYLLSEVPKSSRGKISRDEIREICSRKDPLNLRGILKGQVNGIRS